jgi:hypothetical protein
MTNITLLVRDFLNKNPYIVRSLNDGIINVRALSLYILRKTKQDASLDAIMTGIRRYHKEIANDKEKKKHISEIFRDSRISTKSRLMIIEVKRHFNVLRNLIPSILDHIHVSRGDVLRIVQARESVMFLIDHSKKEEILKLVPKDELIRTSENIGELNIHFSEKHGDMPGILSPVINELSINDISIMQTLSGWPELALIIDEGDISRSHEVMLRFFYGKK